MPKKRSRWDAPPQGAEPPSSSKLATQAAGEVKRKKPSRWGVAPSQEDTMIAQAIESFAKPVTQKLTPDQIRQMMEQQQVLHAWCLVCTSAS